MRMLLGLPDLPRLVETTFKSAKASQSLIFSSTELAILRTPEGLPFQLRYCPALGNKPKPKEEKNPVKKRDVFESPDEALLIAKVPTSNPSHFLVLNKYPVIEEHFILATIANKPQTHVLEQDDLEATYACLKAWESYGSQRRLFAFFNSGDHSGASQPHRHLQFLPIENMKKGDRSNSWNLLVDVILNDNKSVPSDQVAQLPDLLQHPAVPFTHFGFKFTGEPDGSQLLEAYNKLYEAAKEAVEAFISRNSDGFALHTTEEGDLPISYNLAITTDGMAICPRRSGGAMLQRDDGSSVGFIELNGTTLGGTLMVKHQEEWDTLHAQPGKLTSILTALGIPRTE
ncbi:hypothetical protein BDV96DRAFT_244249 [Lophiotrema nucula]|uniref:Uncharacterized protein n=1 Tax=Lophiotrema nucula TaxID=690887 RepID=A0A6A5YRD3_9PLEO|nr:hypothetical protein BDV96DRAFT_244249 [Lophiotrema nucula]